MVDIFSKEKRSEIMSKIRGKDTSIEKLIFKSLRKNGIYFQKYYRLRTNKRLTIDIALPRKKIAIFIDGDFWHGYRFEKNRKRLPKKYWVEKILGNIERDKRNRAKLRKDGWKVLRIWEHEIKKYADKAVEKVVTFLKKSAEN